MSHVLAAAGSVLLAFSSFAEVGYIQSDATKQFINTGYYPNRNTRVELDYAFSDIANTAPQVRLFGNDGGDTGAAGFYCCAYITGTAGTDESLAFAWGDAFKGTGTKTGFDAKRRTAVVDIYHSRWALREGGVEVKSGTHAPEIVKGQAVFPLGLFGRSNDATGLPGQFARLKVYSFKIYEADVLVHDYVPARKAGVVGLYDKVGKGFLCDLRLPCKDFLSGGDLLDVPDDGYLEVSGKSFFNSRIPMSTDLRAEVDFALTDATLDKQWRLLGIENDQVTMSVYDGWSGICFGSGDTWKGYSPGVGADLRRHVAIVDALNDCYVYRTGSLTNHVGATGAVRTKNGTVPIGIMGRIKATSGTVGDCQTKAKLYGARFYKGGKLVHDYVPCKKGDRIGLKDLCDGAFVEDEGTGATAGGAIRVETDDGYLRSASQLCLDTGYCVKPTTRVECDFAFRSATTQQRVFGTDGDALNCNCFFNGANALSWSFQDDASNNTHSEIPASNLSRRTVIVDGYDNKAVIVTAGYTNRCMEITQTHTKTSKATLGLFANHKPDGWNSLATMDLYSFRIYEAGALVHEYLPHVKDGVAGLLDTVTGKLLLARYHDVENPIAFEVGGDIAVSGEKEPAYAMSTGVQSILTDFYMNPNACIDVDFALTATKQSQARIVGSDANGDLVYSVYLSGYNFAAGCGDNGKWKSFAAGTSDIARHRAVMDLKNASFKLYNGVSATPAFEKALTAPDFTITKTDSWPMSAFGRFTDAASTTLGQACKVKIYSIKVYQDGNLVHYYLPYCSATATGFYDTVTGKVLDEHTKQQPLVIGGRGYGAAGEDFETALPATKAVRADRANALRCFAPGAVAYKWTCDGVEIPGETGETLSLTWVKGAKPAQYSVTPIFSVYGTRVEGKTSTCVATCADRGFTLFVK